MSSLETSGCREVALPPGWAPYALAGGTDGELWMTVLDPPGLARMPLGRDPASGIRHEALPGNKGRPMLLTLAADGALWCTRSDDRLSRRDSSGDYTVIEAAPGSAPYGIAAAPDGAVWFTAPGLNQVGRATAAGELTMVDLPAEARPAMLTLDPDGRVWVALNGAGALACVAGGTVRLLDLPGGRASPAPVGIAASTTGIWYADIAGGCVGRVGPSGTVEQFSLADADCRPHAVAADTDGGCWVTLWGSGRLARITADGDVTVRDLPGREPHGLWVGADLVWVAMESGSVVAVEKPA